MQPAEGTIRWVVDDISNYFESGGPQRDSPAAEIGGISWKIRVRVEPDPRTGESSLEACLIRSYPEARRFWRVEMQYAITLVNRDDRRMSLGQTPVNTVCYPDHPEEINEINMFDTVDKIMDPDEGFIRDDDLIVEAEISISKNQGVGIVNDPRDFLSPNEMSDVCLIIENKRVHVTKAILAENSPVFKTMFYATFHEHGKSEIELKDVVHTEFVDLLNILYTSLHGFTDNSVESILALADQFHMKIIMEAAGMFLMLHSRLDLGQRLLLTDTYKLDNAQAYLIYSIKNKFEMKMAQRSEWYRKYSDGLKARIGDRNDQGDWSGDEESDDANDDMDDGEDEIQPSASK